MSDTQRSDVLIVGAGTSGLLAALTLSLMEISVRIIDKAPSSLEENPITVLSPFTLQRLHALGITDFGMKHWRFQTFTNKGSGASASSKERQTYRVWENRDAYCNWGISCPRATLCEKLLETLRERTGLQVDYNHELVNLQDMTAEAIVSTIRNLKTGRAACWRSRIVIGADGADSIVRQKLGISQNKLHVEPPISLYTLQVSATTNFPGAREVATIRKGSDTVLMIGHNDQVYIMLKQKKKWSQLSLLNGDDDLLKGIEAHVKSVLQPYNVSFNHIHEYKRWAVTNRISEKYCVDRRYFLVGNAAQTVTPNEFLSTNLGIDQVQNLCWKLYLYLRQYAPPTLLDTYQIEATARAQEYFAASDLFTTFLTQESGQEEALANLKRTKHWLIGGNIAYPDTIVGSKSSSRVAPEARLKPYTALQILLSQAVKSKSTPSSVSKPRSLDNAQVSRKSPINSSSIWKQAINNNKSQTSLGPALSVVTPFVRGMTKLKTRGYQHYDSDSLVIAAHADRWKSIKANQYKLSERIAQDGSPGAFTLVVFCHSLADPEKMQALQTFRSYLDTSLLHYEQQHHHHHHHHATSPSSTSSNSSPTSPIATSPVSYFSRFSISSQRSSGSSSTTTSSNGTSSRFSRFFFPSFSWSSSSTTTVPTINSKQTIERDFSPNLFSVIYITSSQRQQFAQLLASSSPLRNMYDLSKFYLDQDHQAHRAYEVNDNEPTVVVIRPDGYIGTQVRIRDQLDLLGSYFEGFLKPPIDLDSAAALVADDYF